MKKAILITLGAIIAFAIFMYFRLGMNKDVSLQVQELEALKVLYVQHTGPYYKIAERISFVENWAKANNVTCSKTFGKYLDNPETVDEDRLQSQGGCIIDKMPEGTKPQDEMLLGEIKKGKYLVGTFDGAPSVGPYTVYPKAMEWIKKNGATLDGAIIEIYNVISEKEVRTEYLFPIK